MVPKRGYLVVIVLSFLILFLTLSAAEHDLESGQTRFKDDIFNDDVGFEYTYAIGIGPYDDDIKEGCDPESGVMGFQPDLWQDKVGNRLSIGYGYYDYSPVSNGGLVPRDDQNPNYRCVWKNLPLNERGCIFLSDEWDGEVACIGKYCDATGDPEVKDDCGGWFVPAEKQVSESRITNAESYFFDGTGTTGENSADNSGSGTSTDDSFAFRLSNYPENYEMHGQPEPDYNVLENAICLFKGYDFSSPDQTFICLPRQEEYRWYICDAGHLSKDTGAYIPIPRCQKDYDPENPGKEGSCSDLFPICNEETNTCEDQSGAPEPLENKQGWFCDEEDGEFDWVSRPLTCGDKGINCDSDPVVCKSDLNYYLEMENGNSCCGNDGLEDFATISKSKDGEQPYVCLNKNDDLIGTAKDVSESLGWGVSSSENPELPGDCVDDWCWVSALHQAKFNVVTIKNPLQEPYDIVSDSTDWRVCNATRGESKLNTQDSLFTSAEDKKVANRFYCYDEGNKWSWAECIGEHVPAANQETVKGRYAGEGLYSLFIDGVNPQGEKYGDDIIINNQNGGYQSFYGTNSYYDFSGYSFLEFFVIFTKDSEGTPAQPSDINVPAGIQLKISGPTQDGTPVPYFDQNVIGYAVTSPFVSQPEDPTQKLWTKIRVPLSPNLVGVQQIEIIPSNTNFIGVKNVYLSKSESTPLCSGEPDASENSWITDVDKGDSRSRITGENLCLEQYGPNAWLGNDDEVTAPSANCCGNNLHEYYAGSSENNYGCWNSQPIADKETTMNVEFGVGYNENNKVITYDPDDDLYNIYALYKKTGNILGSSPDEPEQDPDSNEEESEYQTSFATGFLAFPQISIHHLTNPENPSTQESPIQIIFPNTDTIFIKKKIYEVIPPFPLPGARVLELKQLRFSRLEYTGENTESYFLNLFTGENLGDSVNEGNLKYGLENIVIVSERIPPYVSTTENITPQTQTFTYTCSLSKEETGTQEETTECLYSLPGNPPYTIINPHSDLYELYFVTEGNPKEGIPIGSSYTSSPDVYGNIRAKRVAQQVVFVNEDEASEEPTKFYGCQAADFIQNNVNNKQYYENLNYCSTKAGKFCAYSVEHKGETGSQKERFTTINSWSDESIDKVGYAAISDVTGDLSEFYQNNKLQLKPATPTPFTPDQRNFSTSVLPARNFISNAEFTNDGQEIPHWDIIGLTGNEREKDKAANGVIILDAGETLQSERLAVPQNTNVKYSGTGCTPIIILVDKNGQATTASPTTTFNSGDASYVRLEYTGLCTLEKPMLQIIDDKDAVPYYYQHTGLETENFDARAGAACCPSNYCWNGYACVEPMSPFTYLAEHVADGRDYRCINGEWKHQPVKFDWNQEEWGFCDQEDQCFVLSSNKDADNEQDISGFYDGNFPTCINNQEFLFDNYCDNGDWTSRTKFVASKLLEVGESDDYILYCTNYKDALNNFENFGDKENYLGGEFITSEQATPSLGVAIAGPTEPETLHSCFQEISNAAEGKRLIPDNKNTCINNVCVLKPKNGKVAFATTLNKDIDDPDSFLIALNIPQNKLSELCPSLDGFVKCDLSGTDLEGDLWYSSQLNALIYSKDGINLNPTVLDKILDFFSNLFGTESDLSDEEAFIREAHNFRELYLLNKDSKKVRAVQEILSQDQQTLIAEYENFQTPVCDYVKHRELPEELKTELLEDLSGKSKLSCTQTDNIQRVELVAGLDFFWPQLTGQLRTQ